jgi:putative serine protease PepD
VRYEHTGGSRRVSYPQRGTGRIRPRGDDRRRPVADDVPMRNVPVRPSIAVATVLLLAAAAALGGCGGDQPAAGAKRAASTSPSAASGGDPAALQRRFVDVVSTVSPAVVQIRTSVGLGSGIVFDDRGDIVTNAHVVAGSRTFSVQLPDGRRLPATAVGVDRGNDLAVIRLSGTGPAPARFADSSKVRVGDLAFAIGNPLGLASSVTQGIVSSTKRQVSEGNGVTLDSVIQTSAEINPGNSGGALVDLEGGVIGIPTLAAIDPELGDAPAPGIGFAIASNRVGAVANRIISSHGG